MVRVASYVLACTIATCAAVVHAQELQLPDTPEVLDIASVSDRFPAKWYPGRGDGTDVAFAPVLERPYVAVSETKDLRARDKFGRTRTEAVTGGETVNGTSFKIKEVSVSDPVSHCQFHWMERVPDRELPAGQRVAFVTCAPLTIRYKESDVYAFIRDNMPNEATTIGDTTTRVEHPRDILVEGLTVQRMRVTNSKTEADGTVTTNVNETWYSPRLRETIRLGGVEDGAMMLSRIEQKDPDPTLFYPPEGYEVEVQKAR